MLNIAGWSVNLSSVKTYTLLSAFKRLDTEDCKQEINISVQKTEYHPELGGSVRLLWSKAEEEALLLGVNE